MPCSTSRRALPIASSLQYSGLFSFLTPGVPHQVRESVPLIFASYSTLFQPVESVAATHSDSLGTAAYAYLCFTLCQDLCLPTCHTGNRAQFNIAEDKQSRRPYELLKVW